MIAPLFAAIPPLLATTADAVSEIAALDAVRLSFNPSSLWILNACLGLVMFGVALGTRVDDFRRLLREPKPVLIGLLGQWVALPLVTVALILAMDLPRSLALGLMLVASCPGGNISTFLVHLSRGNVALSVSMTSLSSLGSAVATPLIFSGGVALLGLGIDAQVQVDMVDMGMTIALVIVLPLLLGLWVAEKKPELAQRIERRTRWVSMAVLGLFITLAMVANHSIFMEFGHHVVLLVLIHNGLALLAGTLLARVTGLQRPERIAVTLETGIQNSGLGLLLIFTYFGGQGGMALIAAWWGIWHILSGLMVAWVFTRGADRNT